MRGDVPRVMVLTDRQQARGGDLVGVVEAAVRGGADAVLFREKDLGRPERVELAGLIARGVTEARSKVSEGGSGPGPARPCRLIVASDVALAREVGAAGVHLAAADPWPAPADLTVPTGGTGGTGTDERRLLVGRSCHSRAELAEAVGRADYVTLSPVWATSSKRGYGPALGLDAFRDLCQAFPHLPVLALGGVAPGRVAPCLAAGAAGVAVMGEVMRSPDPARLATSLIDELSGSRG